MNRRRIATATTLGTALAALVCPLTGMAAQLNYTIDAGIEDNDNLAVTNENPIRQTLFRTGLGFLLKEDTSRIQASVSGRVEYRDFRNSELSNRTEGTLTGRFNWNAIPQRLDFTIEDNLGMQSVNTLAPNTPNNRQRVNVLSLGPTLFFRLGQTLRGQAELRYIDSKAEITDEFNSGRAGLAFRAIKELSPTSLVSFNLQGERVDFDNNVTARDYDRYESFIRYTSRLRQLDLGADLGYSQLRYRDDQRVSEPLLRANALWHPTERSQLNFAASSFLSDSASAALSELIPGEKVPDTVLIKNSQITSSAYKGRDILSSYAYKGSLVSLSIGPYWQKRDYIDPGVEDQDNTGIAFDIAFRLRPSLTLDGYASQENINYSTLDRKDKSRYLGVSLQKDWSRNWATRLQLARYQRTSTLAGQDVSQNVLYLSMVYKNR